MEAKKHFLQKWHKVALLLIVYDILTLLFSYYGTLSLRFDNLDFNIPLVMKEVAKFNDFKIGLVKFMVFFYVWFTVAVYASCKLYSSIWRFASYRELYRCLLASAITITVQIVGITVFVARYPFSYYIFGSIMQVFFLLVSRFSYRFAYLELRKHDVRMLTQSKATRAMLIGAGEAGRMLIRDLTTSQFASLKIVCIIDDDPNKQKRRLEDIPIVGGRDDILNIAKKYHIQKILYAIPTASMEDRREILNICQETGCEILALPGVFQLLNKEVTFAKMKEVAVEDLLGRDPITVNNEEILNHLTGKTIMVTGGGGSIGSELCRQIASHNPKLLIIFDVYENNAYDIEQELKRNCPKLNLCVLIGSVRDSRRINDVFEEYRPEIVFHAAAHKHVPLMETSPCESIKNNVLGTYKTAFAAMTHGCQRFVLISTDKAVNPTNIMGASKRLCEMVVQTLNRIARSGDLSVLAQVNFHVKIDDFLPSPPPAETKGSTIPTEFVAVRFGNVLGSNGSVIPLFRKQIAAGGPITVTHPDIIRYFMTIPEAVSLVLQASTYAKGGEIFILDMGQPVKIDTLARNLIKLCGLKPDVDIKIEYTGLRPGEKLYEEKLMSEEGLQKTENKLIHIAQPIKLDINEFLQHLNELADASSVNDKAIRDIVAKTVPTYHPASLPASKTLQPAAQAPQK